MFTWATIKSVALALISTILSAITGRKDDAATKAGINDQVLADQKATTNAQAKTDAVPYESAASSRLRDDSF